MDISAQIQTAYKDITNQYAIEHGIEQPFKEPPTIAHDYNDGDRHIVVLSNGARVSGRTITQAFKTAQRVIAGDFSNLRVREVERES